MVLRLVVVLLDGVQVKPHAAGGVGGQYSGGGDGMLGTAGGANTATSLYTYMQKF